MKKRMLAILILAAMLLSLFTACGGKSVLSVEKAQKIALEDAGLKNWEVDDIHTHVTEHEEKPSYSVHITIGDVDYEYVIDAVTGDILYADDIS